MVDVLGPTMAERPRRYAVATAFLHVLASSAGGALTGGTLALLGTLLLPAVVATQRPAALHAAVVTALAMAEMVTGWRGPVWRQVPPARFQCGPLFASAAWGFELGTAFTTRWPTLQLVSLGLATLLSRDLVQGAALFLAFGLARGLVTAGAAYALWRPPCPVGALGVLNLQRLARAGPVALALVCAGLLLYTARTVP
jgi:hypothetical protein